MKNLSLVLVSLFFLFSCSEEIKKAKEEPAVAVEVVSAKKITASVSILSAGKIVSSADKKLSFKTGGIIKSISVKEGMKVNGGKILASLNLNEIDANLKKAKEGFEKFERDFKRAENLFKDKVITYEQFQNAETALKIAENDLNIAEFNFENSVIKAPEKGVILRILAEDNEITGPGTPVIFFGSLQKNWIITAGITDIEVANISVNDLAEVVLDAYKGEVFSAKVENISEFSNPITGLFEIELKFLTYPEKLLHGFICKLKIVPSNKAEYWSVPIESLVDADGNKGFIYFNKNGRAEKASINDYFIYDNMVCTEDNLSDYKQIISSGASYLRVGSKLDIKERKN